MLLKGYRPPSLANPLSNVGISFIQGPVLRVGERVPFLFDRGQFFPVFKTYFLWYKVYPFKCEQEKLSASRNLQKNEEMSNKIHFIIFYRVKFLSIDAAYESMYLYRQY